MTVFPRFKALGMIGWIGRYLDDVLIILAHSTPQQLVKFQAFVEWMGSQDAYEAPLVLNVEPEGDQEFLEANFYSEGRELWAQLHNKVAIDYNMGGKQPYQRRLPLECSLPTAEKIKLVSGLMTRIKQVVHRQQDLLHCLVDLRVKIKP